MAELPSIRHPPGIRFMFSPSAKALILGSQGFVSNWTMLITRPASRPPKMTQTRFVCIAFLLSCHLSAAGSK
jgi:hypothetical protein